MHVCSKLCFEFAHLCRALSPCPLLQLLKSRCSGMRRVHQQESVCVHADCGDPGVRCCDADEQEDPCKIDSFCSSGICVTCGFLGQMCCPGAGCKSDFSTCNSNNLCVASCGHPGLPCCPEDEDNQFGGCPNGSALCESGICVPCGGVGERCCLENRCDFGSECITASGVCSEQTCGVPGLPCYDDAYYAPECGYAAECVAGLCSACGVNGEPCCGPRLEAFPDESMGYCNQVFGECSEEGICTGGQPDRPPPLVGPDGNRGALPFLPESSQVVSSAAPYLYM